MFKRIRTVLVLIGILIPSFSFAQESNVTEVLEPDPAFVEALPDTEFAWARVSAVRDQGVERFDDQEFPFQLLTLEIISGPEAGQRRDLDHGQTFSIREDQLLDVGDEVVLAKNYKVDGSSFYAIGDRRRLPALGVVALLFAILVFAVAGRRGIGAFLGLGLSLAILTWFVVPAILAGWNPLLISIVGAAVIALLSIYLAHGFTRQTSLALASTIITLILAGGLATLIVTVVQLTGAGSEEAYLLQLGQSHPLDLRGLLLGGILIGMLGVLDDVTTAQTAAVLQLREANRTFGFLELFGRGMAIGREHILSLVNTLVLAYAGASLPIFLFFQIDQVTPWWVTLNGEFLTEEIVRALVGSIALILAVPLATGLAAWTVGRFQIHADAS